MDEGLVGRAMLRDAAAFERLAATSIHRLHRLAYSILGTSHGADDATQAALLAIWRDLPRLQDPARFEAWSYRILVRACQAELRRAPRWIPDAFLPAADEPAAADSFGVVHDRDQLERGFRRLSVDQRAVISLHYLMDMPLDRVADALGVPIGTVHSRLNRALDGLRAAFAADARPGVAGREPQEGLR